jgi:predicted small secreted protein
MRKSTTRATLTVLACLSVVPLLDACHTTAGAGKDISKTGQTITRSANEATPK